MWFFRSPMIVFGEDALSWLGQFKGQRASIVTDANMQPLGILSRVIGQLEQAGLDYEVFSEVEPDPSMQTAKRCAARMQQFQPDWVIGLGGGSCLDAAKAAWFLYERPDVELEAVSPLEEFGLRAKARFITIPTTAGSGAEVTAAAVITDTEEQRKLEVACFEVVADVAIIDPCLSAGMPRGLTADTGIDVLTHAIEGYSSTWANDFSDGLCLQATRMVFEYLPRAVARGAEDPEAREKMANAATIAALGMTNSHIVMAHALGHAVGALFHVPHGRITGLFLPYTIEYTGNGGAGRYLDLARIIGLQVEDEAQATPALAEAIRGLISEIGLPLRIADLGIDPEVYEASLDDLCDRAEIDVSLITSRRCPDRQELKRLFRCAFHGNRVDF